MDTSNVRKVLIYGDDFWKSYNKQNQRVRGKINWTIKLVQTLDRIPEKYFKRIVGTTLYEMRILAGSNMEREVRQIARLLKKDLKPTSLVSCYKKCVKTKV